jgi:hypothetical protein
MLQASPQKIDLHYLLAHLSFQRSDTIFIGAIPARSGKRLGVKLAQLAPPAVQTFRFTSQARDTSATDAPNSSRRTAASLNSRVNFRRFRPMTQFSIRWEMCLIRLSQFRGPLQFSVKIFAASGRLNRFTILSEHVKLVPVNTVEMIVERLSPDGASHPPFPSCPK